MPLRRRLVFPRPENPARMPLVGVQLRFNKTRDVPFVIIAQVRHCTGIFASARPNVAGATVLGEGTVITGPFAEPVEPFRAVGLAACPLTYDGPLVSTGELRAKSAGGGDVVARAHCYLGRREDLVLVRVQYDVLVVGVR